MAAQAGQAGILVLEPELEILAAYTVSAPEADHSVQAAVQVEEDVGIVTVS